MILLTTILKRLRNKYDEKFIYLNFDVRYFDYWIDNNQNILPKFIINRKYKIVFNSNLLRYEFHYSK